MADPISDMFIRVKNANTAGRETVSIPHSRFKLSIAHALSRAGLVGEIDVKGKRVRKTIEITLQYKDGEPAVHGVKILSKPSRRVYAPYKKITPARHRGTLFITTPRGIMTAVDARKEKVGGQLIAEVW